LGVEGPGIADPQCGADGGIEAEADQVGIALFIGGGGQRQARPGLPVKADLGVVGGFRPQQRMPIKGKNRSWKLRNW
jgi:hypothetical protein